MYVDLPRAALTHLAEGGVWTASAKFRADILAAEKLVARDIWTVTDQLAFGDTVALKRHIVDVRSYWVSPGDYRVSVMTLDSLSGASWTSSQPLQVPPRAVEQWSASDVQLGGAVIPVGVEPKFDRAGFGLVPNPERTYGTGRETMVYYLEVYPPQFNAEPRRRCRIERTVADGLGRLVRRLAVVERPVPEGSFAEMDAILVSDLPTGIYDLRLSVVLDTLPPIDRQARFFVLSHDTAAPSLPVASPASAPDSAAVEAELEAVRFLFNPFIRKKTERMSIAEKADFLAAFWAGRDSAPSEGAGLTREHFRQRVREADARFGTDRQAGHRTDRGRVYCLFGEPDHRDLRPLDLNAKPYEIWTYEQLEGGVTFVFVDRSGFGEFILVHSDKSGEIRNPNWYNDYVSRSASETGR